MSIKNVQISVKSIYQIPVAQNLKAMPTKHAERQKKNFVCKITSTAKYHHVIEMPNVCVCRY